MSILRVPAERAVPRLATVLGLVVAFALPPPADALECPKPPEQTRSDWDVEVKAAVGRIGPARGPELETRTRTATQDLLAKLPKADKVYLEQMMYATYCSSLRDNPRLSESERGARILAYNEELRKTIHGVKPPPPPPPPDPVAEARLKLSQLGLSYTSATFLERINAGDAHAMKLFLDAGMDPNVRDRSGVPALMRAVDNDQRQIVDLLLRAKANVNAGANAEETAVSWAAARGQKDLVLLLLSHGADRATVDGAFVSAVEAKNLELARLLLARGADARTAGGRALVGLCGSRRQDAGKTSAAQFLLDLGVDVNARNKRGSTALFRCAEEGDTQLAAMLLDRGADVEAVCECDGSFGALRWTALQMAAMKLQRDSVQLLLGRGADVNARDSTGRTALHRAAHVGSVETTALLLGRGADVNTRNEDGETPLMDATRTDVLEALLDARAEVNAADRNGWTTLMHRAHWGGPTDLATLLLRRGANVEARSTAGHTALGLAVLRRNPGYVRVLLKAGATVTNTDAQGKTVFDYVEEIGDEKARESMTQLLKSGAPPAK